MLVGGLLAWRIKRESIGDYLKLTTDSRTAVMKADAVLREHGLDPNSFRKGALFVDTTNPVSNEYLRRRMSITEINKIYAERVPGALWRVRYFRNSQAEEFAVTLQPDGALHGFWHTLPEAAKGATLGKEEAVAIAEGFLREKKQIDLSGWKLVESSSDKRPNRTDHMLTWQQNVPLDPQNAGGMDAADHAYARMDLHILGNEPANYRTYIKIPDEFERKQDEQSLPRTLFNVGRFVVAVGLAIVVLIVYFKRSRIQSNLRVPWRRLMIWGLVGLAVYLFQFLLGKGIPETLAGYSTADPWKIFLAGIVVRQFIATAFIAGALVFLFGLAWHFAARAFGEERVPMWLGMPANYYRDAFWIGLGGSVLLIGLQRFLSAASLWWPTLQRAVPNSFGTSFDALVPAAGLIGGALYRGLLFTAVLAVAVAFIGAELRVRWLRLLLFFAMAAAMVLNWGSPADFLKQFLMHLMLLTFWVFGIRWVARFNLLGWFLVIVCTTLPGAGFELTGQPDAFYRSQGYIVLTAMVVLLAWPLVLWRLRPGERAAEG